MYSLGGQAQAKRRKTTAERKAEDEAKRAEREGANRDEPWSLQVLSSLPGVSLASHLTQSLRALHLSAGMVVWAAALQA